MNDSDLIERDKQIIADLELRNQELSDTIDLLIQTVNTQTQDIQDLNQSWQAELDRREQKHQEELLALKLTHEKEIVLLNLAHEQVLWDLPQGSETSEDEWLVTTTNTPPDILFPTNSFQAIPPPLALPTAYKHSFTKNDWLEGCERWGVTEGVLRRTMVGDWMWKYTRHKLGYKRNQCFFWLNPYTHILYWSSQDNQSKERHSNEEDYVV